MQLASGLLPRFAASPSVASAEEAAQVLPAVVAAGLQAGSLNAAMRQQQSWHAVLAEQPVGWRQNAAWNDWTAAGEPLPVMTGT